MLEARAEPVDSLNNLPLPLVILLAVPATIIILLTVFGNLLVLCFKARVGRSNTTLLVWNLGLTDFLVGVIVLPLGAIHLLYRKWVFGRALCRIWVAADVTFCTCSVVTICTISVDRYLAVTRPLRYKSVITKCKVILVIIVIWTFSSTILLTTVRWDGWGGQDDIFDESTCFAGHEIRYLAHSVVFAFFLPASVTLTLYWRIYKLARNRQKALDRGFLMILGHNMNFLTNTLSQSTALRVHIGRNNGMVEHQRRVLRTHERIAKTLGVVSCSFLFCWLPFFTIYLARYCNSMLNPIIYSFTVKEFKRSTLRALLPAWRLLHRCLPKWIAKPPEGRMARMTRNVAGKTKMGRKNKNSNALNSSKSPIKRRSTTPAPYHSTRRNNSNNGLRSQFSEKRRRVPIDSMLEQRKLLNTEEEEYVQISHTSVTHTTTHRSSSSIVVASQTARPFHSNYEYGGDYPVNNNNNTTSTLSRSTETLSSSTNDLIRMPCRYSLKRHSSPATTILRRTSTISNFLLARKRRAKSPKVQTKIEVSSPNQPVPIPKPNKIIQKAAQARNWLLTGNKRRIEWNNNSIVAIRQSLEIEVVQSRCQSEALGEGSPKKGRRKQLMDGWTRQQSADNAELARYVEDTRFGNKPVMGNHKEVTLRSPLANGPAICRHIPKQMSLPHPKLTVNSTQCCSVRVYCTTNETDL